jgi:hypothetical protein
MFYALFFSHPLWYNVTINIDQGGFSMQHNSQLSKGIFWVIPDIPNREREYQSAANDLYIYSRAEEGLFYLPIPCDRDGDLLEDSRNYPTDIYNHKKAWDTMQLLHFPESKGHSYQFNPRGRVVITHGKATIYLNPHINTPDVQEAVKAAFGLAPENEISSIVFRSDGSDHYRCHLDDDTIT